MKKIIFFIAQKNFRDEEYFIPKNIFEKNQFRTETASISRGMAIGSEGGDAVISLSLDDVNVDDFDAFVFVGGGGALIYLDNEKVYSIIKEARTKKKVIGAICIAPVILAKAGILEGVRATVWSSSMEKRPIKALKENKAIYVDEGVVVDKSIITAKGPSFSNDFAKKIIDILVN